jgi:hypothetical protein
VSERKANDGKWAPWWIYVVLIVGCNLVKQKLLEGQPAALNIAITAVLVAVLFFGITAVYRGIASK